MPAPVRVLGLGNEILGDDAFGILVARAISGSGCEIPKLQGVAPGASSSAPKCPDSEGNQQAPVPRKGETGQFGDFVACPRNRDIEVVTSSASGLHLLDYILDCSRLIVVDTVQTGRAEPGAIYVLREEDLPRSAADCPHGMGLFDALRLARQLGLNAPEEITIIAVEAGDCHTVGGPMHPAVAAAIPRALDAISLCCG